MTSSVDLQKMENGGETLEFYWSRCVRFCTRHKNSSEAARSHTFLLYVQLRHTSHRGNDQVGGKGVCSRQKEAEKVTGNGKEKN